jgi:hypothetical protein
MCTCHRNNHGYVFVKLSTANGLVPLKRTENILLDSKVDYQSFQLDEHIYLTEINDIRDTQAAAKHLMDQPVNMRSKDGISCIVVNIRCYQSFSL